MQILNRIILAILAVTFPEALRAATTSPGPERVLILYNANWTGDQDGDGVQDSLEVANYYAQKRGVPAANLLGVRCSVGGGWPYGYSAAQYTNFVNEVVLPVRNKLAALGPTSIDVLLLSYGMPHTVATSSSTISLDNTLMGLNYWSTSTANIFWAGNPYLEVAPTFSADNGHFDHATFKFYGTELYLVSRLDGPNRVWGVMDLVDEGRYGDRYISAQSGYYHGNVYVDSRNLKGTATDANLTADTDVRSGAYYSYEATDVNIAYGEHYVLGTGLPLKWHRDGSIIGTAGTVFQDGSRGDKAPQALLYGGWYAYNNYLPGVWEWLPGSVACDLDSSSLGWDIRSPFTLAWASQALANGASCVCGVVGEPYTTGHTRPNILLWALLRGYNFAEASALANPAIGWMSMAIGDPLYAPFVPKTPVLDTQPPVFSTGYPRILQSNKDGNVVEILVDDTPEPEVVRARIDYGTNTNYGSVISSVSYARHHRIELLPLPGGTTMHCRVTVTDPAGHTVVSGDLTFTTPVQRPYKGLAPANIPGVVQCVSFDEGGEGVAYHDREPENYSTWQSRVDTGVEINTQSPYYLNYYSYGSEWLKYTVQVNQTAGYWLDVYTKDGGEGKFHVECDGVALTKSLTPASGSTWTAVRTDGIPLTAGQHVLRLVMDGNNQARVGSFYYMQFNLEPPLLLSAGVTNGGTALSVSWPIEYLGWKLQAQTNAPGVGVGAGWYALPGSTATNALFLAIDASEGSVFYRLVSP